MFLPIAFIKISSFFILIPFGSTKDDIKSGILGVHQIVGNSASLLSDHLMLANWTNDSVTFANFGTLSQHTETKISEETPMTTMDPMESCPDDGSLFDSSLGGMSVALLVILFWHIVRMCCKGKSKPPSPPSRAHNSSVAISN
ncbi:hypothetical protein Mgra_00000112 [Meloidogyne graminicola]|uniref:Uncharacterized protein n=1 Tax=Meloidogyne graminicola TaxID=189291 RepID=A0A8T0A2E4_9BILA|nr:hypothetical protein Mgra_00000112 [Meloidogyne graminicola]